MYRGNHGQECREVGRLAILGLVVATLVDEDWHLAIVPPIDRLSPPVPVAIWIHHVGFLEKGQDLVVLFGLQHVEDDSFYHWIGKNRFLGLSIDHTIRDSELTSGDRVGQHLLLDEKGGRVIHAQLARLAKQTGQVSQALGTFEA
uniref:Uncharacterized protein n=1 Tax=Marseillevirus LCMAC101 TaxID=2506602 RepID=A0A481YSB0_9VIRU|nr:MAG: hypothetical protein LCMAC101_06930 [Marseillevirus LCMAC101]